METHSVSTIAVSGRAWNPCGARKSRRPIGPHAPKVLGPGGNNVNATYLEALGDNKAVNAWFDRGWLVLEETGEGDPEGPTPPESLEESYGDEASIKLVAVEMDIDTLRVWLENDSRLDVVKAINTRLAQLGGQTLHASNPNTSPGAPTGMID